MPGPPRSGRESCLAWGCCERSDSIGRITTAGAITEYAVPTANSVPSSIAAGSDGALWFTENGGQKIGRITTAGAISEYPLPNANANPDGMAEGPDGAVWFIEQAQVGRITTSGTIVSYPLASAATDSINGMVTGPDGAVWFTERVGNAIVRVAP
jgi:virginiamycin B lyase